MDKKTDFPLKRRNKFLYIFIINGLSITLLLILWFATYIHWLFIPIGLFLLILSFVYFYGMFHPKSTLFFYSIQNCSEMIVSFNGFPKNFLLRFDDGPHPKYTQEILNLLDEYSIKAIFFITGENAQKHPDLIKQIQRRGHWIGNHTLSHPYHFVFFSKKQIRNELQQTNEILKTITGEVPKYFSPPMGHKNLALAKVLKEMQMQPIMWSLQTKDTTLDKNQIIKTVKQHFKTGDIILLHDGIYKWTNIDRYPTIEALKILLPWLKDYTNK